MREYQINHCCAPSLIITVAEMAAAAAVAGSVRGGSDGGGESDD